MLRKTRYENIVYSQYTSGGQLMTIDGKEYIGYYHIYPDGKYGSNPDPDPETVELVIYDPLRISNQEYFHLTNIDRSGFIEPNSISLSPTIVDIERGFMKRHFLQRWAQPENTIIEVDRDQFRNYGTLKSQISADIWNRTQLDWSLVSDENSMAFNNANTLRISEKKFPGIVIFLSNLLEYREYIPNIGI